MCSESNNLLFWRRSTFLSVVWINGPPEWFIHLPPFYTCVAQVTGGIGTSSRSALCMEGWWWRERGSAVTVDSFWVLVVTFFFFVPPMGHVFMKKAHDTSLAWDLCHGWLTEGLVLVDLDLHLHHTESKVFIVLCCLSNSSGACCSACVQKWSSIIISNH